MSGLLVVIFVLKFFVSFSTGCPDRCFCLENDVICIYNGSDLASIPDYLPGTLTELRITHCQLTGINASDLAKYPMLKRLVLDHNRIETIEKHSFKGLPNLEYLSIKLNPTLNKLEEGSFGGLRGPELHVSLMSNNIKRIEKHVFFDSHKLSQLDLRHNPIEIVDSRAFSGLHDTKFVYLPRKIRAFAPNAFQNFSWISIFFVNEWLAEESDHKGIPKFTFNGLSHVKKLAIQNSRLGKIKSHAFSGVDEIHEIHIKNSTISHISRRAFAKMRNVRRLFLEKSQIGFLDRNLFRHIDTLHINLHGNRLDCQCENMWLLDEEEPIPENVITNNTCHFPAELQNTKIKDIPKKYVENCKLKMKWETRETYEDEDDDINSNSSTKRIWLAHILSLAMLLVIYVV